MSQTCIPIHGTSSHYEMLAPYHNAFSQGYENTAHQVLVSLLNILKPCTPVHGSSSHNETMTSCHDTSSQCYKTLHSNTVTPPFDIAKPGRACYGISPQRYDLFTLCHETSSQCNEILHTMAWHLLSTLLKNNAHHPIAPLLIVMKHIY
jgi:hypothetical protein